MNQLSHLNADLSAQCMLNIFTKPRLREHKPRGIFKDHPMETLKFYQEDISIYRFGKGEKRILMAHGWEGQASDFYQMIPDFIQAGYEVITFDGPAHGKSSGKKTNIFEFIQLIDEINQKWPIDFALGHSMGGVSIGLTQYLSHSFNPEKLIIMGSPNKIEIVIEKFLSHFKLNEKVRESFVELIEKNIKLKVSGLNLESALANTNSLLVYDEDDLMVPYGRALEIKKSVENIELLTTSGLGHIKILRNQQIIEYILKFIQK
jgi:pimeloyl-ACP methyl ester carboxylesterase